MSDRDDLFSDADRSRSESQPLAGVVVVDLGQIYAAPYATMLMALAGAKIIKVEPLSGEPLRARGAIPGTGAELPYFFLNSNKSSVTINLKDPTGRSLLLRLLERAQVIVENFRPGVMDRLGLGATELCSRDPALIYASLSGYGQRGIYTDLPAMDLTIQAMAGVMSATGFESNPPVKAGPAIGDFLGGSHLYSAIVTALYQRAATGRGARLDIALLDCVFPSLLSNIGLALGTAGTSRSARTGNRHGGLAYCPYNVYQTADGYISILTITGEQWQSLLTAMGRDDLLKDADLASEGARVARMDEVDQLVESWTKTGNTIQVFDLLKLHGVPCAPVRSIEEVLEDPHLRDRGMIQDHEVAPNRVLPLNHSPLYFEGEARVPLKSAPSLGQDNVEIFVDWLGVPQEEYDELRREAVI